MSGQKLAAVLILLTGGFIYYFSAPKTEKEFPSAAAVQITEKLQVSEPATIAQPAAKPTLPTPKISPQVSAPETEKLKEFNRVHVARVSAQMKSNEIASLKKSILNDQQVLKKIEKDGSNIEMYQLVRANLEKRKQRLNHLIKQ